MRTRDFILGLGICMIWLGVISFVQMTDYKSMENDRYNAGVIAGIRMAKQMQKESNEEAAMMWWTGSTDLSAARKRLCNNVDKKGLK